MKTHIFSIGLLAILLLASSLFAQGQTYMVAHIKGTPPSVSGLPIKIGQTLSPSAKLVYSDANAHIILIDQGLKRFKLQTTSSKPDASGGFELLLQDGIVPIPKTRAVQMVARGYSENGGITDFQAYFGNDRFYIIGDTLKVKVSEQKLALDSSNVVVYRYGLQDDVIQKMVKHDSINQLIIQKNSLYLVKDHQVDEDLVKEPRFYHFDQSQSQSKVLASFLPAFIEEEVLRQELNMLINHSQSFKGLKGKQLMEELCTFVFDVYGKTDLNKLQAWIETKTVYHERK